MFIVTGYTYRCNRNTTYSLKNDRLVSGNVVLRMFVLNPLKAQPLYELCGEMDPVTQDWTDGTSSILLRE